MTRNITSKLDVTDGLDFSPEQGITEIALDKLIPYSRHSFKLYDGERLDDMIQSIAKNGVITPIIVRTADNGKYEILAGHNRAYAAKKAGINKIPAVVKANLSDEEAEIYVVETYLMLFRKTYYSEICKEVRKINGNLQKYRNNKMSRMVYLLKT